MSDATTVRVLHLVDDGVGVDEVGTPATAAAPDAAAPTRAPMPTPAPTPTLEEVTAACDTLRDEIVKLSGGAIQPYYGPQAILHPALYPIAQITALGKLLVACGFLTEEAVHYATMVEVQGALAFMLQTLEVERAAAPQRLAGLSGKLPPELVAAIKGGKLALPGGLL